MFNAIPSLAIWLPGAFHGDPGDRLIVATAREMGVPVVTRDRAVLGYGRVVGVGC
jgi:PIN domain nuclease of toxin-antitoxin system